MYYILYFKNAKKFIKSHVYQKKIKELKFNDLLDKILLFIKLLDFSIKVLEDNTDFLTVDANISLKIFLIGR